MKKPVTACTNLIHFAFSQTVKMVGALSKNEEVRRNILMTKERTERSQSNF